MTLKIAVIVAAVVIYISMTRNYGRLLNQYVELQDRYNQVEYKAMLLQRMYDSEKFNCKE